jgi:hypothetical protein
MAFTITNAIPVNITLGTPPLGSLVTYTTVIGGAPVGNVEFIISAGALPDGLSLNEFTGTISGKPNSFQAYSFTLTGRDDSGVVVNAPYAGNTVINPLIPPYFVGPTPNPVLAYEPCPYEFTFNLFTWDFTGFIQQTAGLSPVILYENIGHGTILIKNYSGSSVFPQGTVTNCYSYTDPRGMVGNICYQVSNPSAAIQIAGKLQNIQDTQFDIEIIPLSGATDISGSYTIITQ